MAEIANARRPRGSCTGGRDDRRLDWTGLEAVGQCDPCIIRLRKWRWPQWEGIVVFLVEGARAGGEEGQGGMGAVRPRGGELCSGGFSCARLLRIRY